MQDKHDISKLLRSIRNALWMILAILLIQLSFYLDDFSQTNFAKACMLFAFWSGMIIFFCTLIRVILGLTNSKPQS